MQRIHVDEEKYKKQYEEAKKYIDDYEKSLQDPDNTIIKALGSEITSQKRAELKQKYEEAKSYVKQYDVAVKKKADEKAKKDTKTHVQSFISWLEKQRDDEGYLSQFNAVKRQQLITNLNALISAIKKYEEQLLIFSKNCHKYNVKQFKKCIPDDISSDESINQLFANLKTYMDEYLKFANDQGKLLISTSMKNSPLKNNLILRLTKRLDLLNESISAVSDTATADNQDKFIAAARRVNLSCDKAMKKSESIRSGGGGGSAEAVGTLILFGIGAVLAIIVGTLLCLKPGGLIFGIPLIVGGALVLASFAGVGIGAGVASHLNYKKGEKFHFSSDLARTFSKLNDVMSTALKKIQSKPKSQRTSSHLFQEKKEEGREKKSSEHKSPSKER